MCFTWSDDYILGLFNHVDGLIHVDLCVCACDLHGLSCASGGCAVASQDHVGQRTIHGLTGGERDCVFPFYGCFTFCFHLIYLN